MHLKEIAKSWSFRRSGSSRYVESSILSENLTSQSMRFTRYENLNKSMRMQGFVIDESGDLAEAQRSGSSRWRSKLKSMSLSGRKSTTKFSFDDFPEKQKAVVKSCDEMKEGKLKVKKKSSWLPDRNRRWPVQGW